MKLSTGVFSDNSLSTISQRTFFGAIAGFVGYGLLMTILMASKFAPIEIPSLSYLIWLGIVMPIAGCILSTLKNPIISFIGYNLIVIPLGLVMGPVVNKYSVDAIQNVSLITAIVTGLMGIAGVMLPKIFSKMGNALFYSLLGLLVVRILGLFIPAIGALTLIDYIAAGIFSLYIGYDMYRATTISRSYGNACKIAVSLYLDIINLFLTILSFKK